MIGPSLEDIAKDGPLAQGGEGQGPDYQYTAQRMAMERDKGYKTPKTKIDAEFNQWRELEDYLPHIFIGDPERYNGLGNH